ncbi:MAG: DUF3300 domain-containing protein [Proteobacteria bacterium]|nr:DUF3300 domain-containing protein [Pseudomonadota bacterium]
MRQRRMLQHAESIYVLRNLFRVSPLLLILAALWIMFAENAEAREIIEVTPAPLVAEHSSMTPFDAAQLQQLVAPIALYSDDLLALVLGAAAHPLQAISAARRLRERRNSGEPIDYAPEWHPSVVALTHYPQILERFDQDLEWTQQLHQAVQEQNADVLEAVQSFRKVARQTQNLSNTDQIVVEEDQDFIRIRQRDPEVIYVPTYQPRDVIIVRTSPVSKIHYRTRHSPIVYRSYNRFDPYRSSRVYHDPFWHDAFWDDPLWGVNSGLYLSWRDRPINHYRPARHRAKKWKRKQHRRSHNKHRKPLHRSARKTKRTDKPVNKLTAHGDRHNHPKRRHHSADAFNQPMLETGRPNKLNAAHRKTEPRKHNKSVKTQRSDRQNRKSDNGRRYTPDKKPVMHSNRPPGRREQIK